MTIVWDSSYAVGYRQIDLQHQELFDRFNALNEACRQRQGREELIRFYKFLDIYVEEHFNAELSLMESCNYPETTMHVNQHRDFIEKLNSWHHKLQQDGATLDLLVETNEALLHWLIRHIRTVDVDLGTFLNRRKT
jgi:hemerythrin